MAAPNASPFIHPPVAGTNAQIKSLAESTKFSDIFETAAYNNGCPAGFTSINQDDVGPECLKLKVRRRQPASGPSGKPVCLLSAAAATP
jgi:hypothetical protein